MKKKITIAGAVLAVILLSVVLAVTLSQDLAPYMQETAASSHFATGAWTEAPAATVEGFEMVAAENGQYQLLANADGSIAVVSKATGAIWRSNPEGTDPIAKGINKTNLTSQMYITFVNANGNNTAKNSAVEVVNKDLLTWQGIENGICYTYLFKGSGVQFSVYYTLEEDGLRATIPVDEIQETNENFHLTSISLLPWFDAADSQSTGYMLVPDGSGALIYNNNNKASYGAYSQTMYGRDAASVLEARSPDAQVARMPVFGMKDGNSGFLAVITDGDTAATLTALTSGTVTSYNNVYATFRYRSFTMTTFLAGDIYHGNGTGGDTQLSMRLASVTPQGGDYEIKYLLLEDENLSYAHMAQAYRKHLIAEEGLTARPAAARSSLFLQLLGSLKKENVVLGIKLEQLQALTTFDEAETILSAFRDQGVGPMTVQFTGWQDGGMESAIPVSAKDAAGKLGGYSGYRDLAAWSKAHDVQLFLDVDTVNLHESGNGVSSFSNAVQTIANTPTYLYTYDQNTLVKNVSDRWKLLTPTMSVAAVARIAQHQDSFQGAGLSLGTMGNTIYSDFTEKSTGLDMHDVKPYWQHAFAMADDAFDQVMTDSGNAYTFPYVSHIYNTPTDCSWYDIEDAAVPFYQMVLHGYVALSTMPLNLSSDPDQLMLKAVETGTDLAACLMNSANYELRETHYEHIFSAHYSTWLDRLAQYSARTAPVLTQVAGSPIAGHEQVAPNVYRTTFENGVTVYVNYGDQPAQADGLTVAGMDFAYRTSNDTEGSEAP